MYKEAYEHYKDLVSQVDEEEKEKIAQVILNEIVTEEGKTWYLVMPYRGDFGGDPNLDDGWIMNIYTDRQGNFVLYTFVHETDPRHSDELPEIWGSWAIYKDIAVGKSYSADQ